MAKILQIIPAHRHRDRDQQIVVRAMQLRVSIYSLFHFESVTSMAFHFHLRLISVPFVQRTEGKVMIEINDSDDEMQEVKIERQKNRAQNENDVSNVVTNATTANIPASNATANFDRNRSGAKSNAEISSSSSSLWSSTKDNESRTCNHNQTKSAQFKCKYCIFGSNFKGNLQRHEKIHVREGSMGFARDPKDGVLHCSHCPEKFKQLRGILSHMQKHHTKNI